ncbi:MAG: hypothetical protein ACW99G_15325 [Candidatus Thorarchaeota archaeon]|jgi:hypothetical protein
MIDTNSNIFSDHKDFNVAEFIEWAYETSGDYDEAMRVYIEKTQLDGQILTITPEDKVKAREALDLEFGDKQ